MSNKFAQTSQCPVRIAVVDVIVVHVHVHVLNSVLHPSGSALRKIRIFAIVRAVHTHAHTLTHIHTHSHRHHLDKRFTLSLVFALRHCVQQSLLLLLLVLVLGFTYSNASSGCGSVAATGRSYCIGKWKIQLPSATVAKIVYKKHSSKIDNNIEWVCWWCIMVWLVLTDGHTRSHIHKLIERLYLNDFKVFSIS